MSTNTSSYYILCRNRERQIFTSNIIHVDEVRRIMCHLAHTLHGMYSVENHVLLQAAVLVAEHEQLRKSLQTKQAELRSLQDGSAQEQRCHLF